MHGLGSRGGTSRLSNLALIGFMGCGKSTVGRILARKTGWTFVDLDGVIVKQAGCSIPQIFSRFGEEHFRKLETEALETHAPLSHTIVATGGGLPAREENWPILDQSYLTVYLKCHFYHCYQRISGDRNRPLLSQFPDRESLDQLYQKRVPYYERARVIIDTVNRSPNAIAKEIVIRARIKHPFRGQHLPGAD